MFSSASFKVISVIIGLILAFLCIKFALPLFLPFLLGGLLALMAEPLVHTGCTSLRLSRNVSTGIGVSLTLLLLLGITGILGAVAVRQAGSLAAMLPDLERTAQNGLDTLQSALHRVADRAPTQLQGSLNHSLDTLFSQQDGILGRSLEKLPVLFQSIARKIPGGALGVGTAVLSAYLISARLPVLRDKAVQRIPPALAGSWAAVRGTLGAWLKAQGKLMALTYGIVTLGLLVARIPYAPAWALLVAAVDSVPLLGTGTILVPWALVLLVQSRYAGAVTMLLTYVAAMLTRTVLEPKLVGKHLGLDPLITLVCLYCGYRLLGFWGLILAPMAAALGKTLYTQILYSKTA